MTEQVTNTTGKVVTVLTPADLQNALSVITGNTPPPPPPPSPDGTTIPPATSIVDPKGNTWTVNGGVIALNGTPDTHTRIVTLLLLYKGVIYQENSQNNWWSWNGTTWDAASDPRVAPPPPSGPVPPPQAVGAGFSNVKLNYVPSAGACAGLDINFDKSPGHLFYPAVWWQSNQYNESPANFTFDASDGALVMTPSSGQPACGIESANDVNPSNSLTSWKYGYFELDCKPQNGSNWWFLSADWIAGKSGAIQGEIDVFEASSDPASDRTRIISTCHENSYQNTGPWNNGSAGWGPQLPNGANFAGQRHLVGFLWTASEIKIYVDNKLINTFSGSEYYSDLQQAMVMFLGYDDNYMDQKTTNDSPREFRVYRLTVYG